MALSSDGPAAESPAGNGRAHIKRLADALDHLETGQLQVWGQHLAAVLQAGGRLLAAGNGGSAAQAQHLSAELVGRFSGEREPFSAIALHAEPAAVTAVANDYGYPEVFARQVRAHGRPGDVLLLLSTSGRSANLLRAAEDARAAGLTVWALTGAAPNPLAAACTAAVTVPATVTATVQECHTVALHLLCAAVDGALEPAIPEQTAGRPAPRPASRAPGGPRPVAVVGDVVLDQDLAGEVRRISPEAPVPVVDEVTARYRPGGAGLAALLAARSGCDVILVTAMSQDGPGRRLTAMLRDAGIRIIDLGRDGPTPVKTRVRADGRTMIMLSEAPSEPGKVSRPLTGAERDLVLGAGAVLVSDYGGGIAGLPGVRSVLTAAAGRVPVVWDVRYGGADPVPGVRLVTPNVRTAAQLAAAVSGDGLGPDIDRGRLLLSSWSAVSVAVTRGSQGAVLLDGHEALPLVISAPAASAGDSCGAGDCFAATAASRLASGALVSEAVTVAVAAASAFVAAGGAAVLGRPEGQEPAAESAGDAVTRVRAAGGTVVATSGCFDLLHSGHVAMLRQARSLGDWLVVCLNDDDSVRRLKGADRPIMPAADRAATLMALASVDDVIVFGENRPDDALRQIRPDIYVKGGDYRIGDVLEAQLVASWNGRTVIVPYIERWSTTKVINEVIQRARPAGPAG